MAPVNDAPVAQDDTASTDEDTPVTIDVLANDSDVDGDPLTVTEATSPDGDVTINSDGTLTFTPTPGFSGDATVTYTVDDGNGGTDTATLFVTVEENPLDGTVEGTAGDDLIDVNYLGDPDGDRVDNEDAILPGAAPNDDLIFGFEGNDTILAGLGDDEVYGGDDDDVINGGAGDDTLFGDDGDDSIEGGTGNDSIYGGEGNDTLRGGQDDDLIEGGNGDDSLFGGSGNDTLIAGAGNDEITGGSGDDVIFAGEGDDSVIAGSGDDTVYGGGGNNTISTGDGNDVVYLGDGDNVVDTSGHAPIPDIGYPGVYPSDPDPNDDRDLVFGGAGNDTITTGDDRDTIFGGAGNDVIDAGIDDDYVEAGEGDDTVIGGEGRDTILGGDGDDVLYGGLDLSVSDLVNLPDDGSGPFGPDLVTDNNIDTIFGGDGNDTIYGMDDNDELYGGEGDDVVFGGVDNDLIHGDAGNDTLSGDQGDDTIFGGDGDDVIEGGIGADQMFGGFGSDTFLGGNGGDVVIGGEDPDGNDWDVLDLTGSNVDFITYDEDDPTYDPVTGVGESGTVTFLDGSTMTFAEIENVIPCFTPGTTIATPRGERLVEELQEGDRIITRDNGIQEIRWVGHKVIDGKALVRNPHLKPILIKAGALGNGLPERDMLVSPNHRILVSGDKTQLYFEESEVLAAAKHLVGAEGIHQVDVMQTTYVHFMFDRHEVVLSNGAWTESFQPGDYSLKGIGNSQRTEIFELFPELKSKPGLEGYQAARRALKKHEAKLLLK
ncbi:MAG: putative Ca2+-binding protein [Rhodobacteraceae bacterium HLUCCA08]|nr:MAG: putative Ca2+-binding protein [Rhodobacteraceae bacterium HLUCCA08]